MPTWVIENKLWHGTSLTISTSQRTRRIIIIFLEICSWLEAAIMWLCIGSQFETSCACSGINPELAHSFQRKCWSKKDIRLALRRKLKTLPQMTWQKQVLRLNCRYSESKNKNLDSNWSQLRPRIKRSKMLNGRINMKLGILKVVVLTDVSISRFVWTRGIGDQ